MSIFSPSSRIPIFDIKTGFGQIELKCPSGLYAISFKDSFIYVGMSHKNLEYRVNRLNTDSDLHPILAKEVTKIGRKNLFLHIKITNNIKREDLLKLEKKYIRHFRPRCNILR